MDFVKYLADKVGKKKEKKTFRGQAMDIGTILTAVVGLVAVVLTMLIGLQLNESVKASINRGSWGASANTTYTSLTTNTDTGFSLLAIAPIIMGAVAVVSLLVGLTFISRVFRSA